MKKRNLVLILAIAVTSTFTACEKFSNPAIDDVVGTYIGTITTVSELKSLPDDAHDFGEATAVVTNTGDGLLEVHCYANDLDTTFMLNYYEHNDSLMVCHTGNDFEFFYGHMLGLGHMSGGMMGDIPNGETDWMHHMNDEHEDGDDHFGGFDMMNESFTYSMMMEGNPAYYLKFSGTK